uniref:Uncharacterized protein n=1 Tax=Lepeophtheirus salmonis TaxID=72036 RepID=A0A0K2VK87_LEPSM
MKCRFIVVRTIKIVVSKTNKLTRTILEVGFYVVMDLFLIFDPNNSFGYFEKKYSGNLHNFLTLASIHRFSFQIG